MSRREDQNLRIAETRFLQSANDAAISEDQDLSTWSKVPRVLMDMLTSRFKQTDQNRKIRKKRFWAEKKWLLHNMANRVPRGKKRTAAKVAHSSLTPPRPNVHLKFKRI